MSTTEEFMHGVAVDALALSRRNESEIAKHEAICAERYENINENIAGLRAIFKWMGGAMFTLILAAFGFLINNITTTNEALTLQRDSAGVAASRIELLQDTLARERRAQQHQVEARP